MGAEPRPIVFLDYDGVIVNSEADVRGAIEATLGCEPFRDVPTQKIADFRGMVHVDVLSIRTACGVPDCLHAEFERAFVERLVRLRSALFAGMTDVVRTLSSEFDVVILSSNSRETIAAVLGAAGCLGNGAAISGLEDRASKAARIARMREESRDRTPGAVELPRACLVGDTVGDLKMAHKAGVPAVAVGWGYHSPAMLATVRGVRHVAAPEDLVASIRASLGRS